MKTVIDFWSGKRPLAQAFWLVWVLGGLLVGILVWIPLVGGLNLLPSMLVAFVAAASLAVLAYQVFCFVSVWRCAVNVKARAWMVVARVLVVLSAVQLTLILMRINGLFYGPVVDLFGKTAG